MRKFVIFAITVMLAFQASMALASGVTAWKVTGESALSNVIFSGGDSYTTKGDHTVNGQNGYDRVVWGTNSLFASQFDGQYNHASGLSHSYRPADNNGVELVSGDYLLSIQLSDKDGLGINKTLSGTLHFDYAESAAQDYAVFIMTAETLSTFNQIFAANGILYETRLDIAALQGDALTLAQNHLGVGSGTQLFGWTVGSISTHYNFNLNLTPMGNAPVPVPGAIWLMGSGLAGIIAIRRRNAK